MLVSSLQRSFVFSALSKSHDQLMQLHHTTSHGTPDECFRAAVFEMFGFSPEMLTAVEPVVERRRGGVGNNQTHRRRRRRNAITHEDADEAPLSPPSIEREYGESENDTVEGLSPVPRLMAA
jgi:hypothetical protein